MADELLSVESSGLVAIANAIRTKGDTNAPLTFPDGFVSALQAITTEATVTPKITPQQKVLTPSDTSFALQAGFHDGSGTVSIQTETGSANPTSTQQTYFPSTGKFFSSFYVGGLGAGYQVVTGTVTYASGSTITINNLGFTPVGMMGVLANNSEKLVDNIFCFQCVPNVEYVYIDMDQFGSSGSFLPVHTRNTYQSTKFTFSDGSASFDASSSIVRGTYFYVIWGN